MNENQTPVIVTVIVATIVMLVCGSFAVSSFNNNMKLVADGLDDLNIPTATEIANLIVIPETPNVDNEKLDRVCELTDGCEYWEGDVYDLLALDDNDAEEDFFDVMVDLTDIDEDYLIVQDKDDIKLKEYQVRAYSDDDKEDENWEIKTFIKVRYYDSDEADSFTHEDAEYMYLVVTSTLDEGEYDSLSIEEVSRNFEFN